MAVGVRRSKSGQCHMLRRRGVDAGWRLLGEPVIRFATIVGWAELYRTEADARTVA
jgi:hypothetical protein